MMAANRSQKIQNGSMTENVLQRVLQLPVVTATCESLQRTYTSTKEVHPLVASVCEAYEKGVKGASSLAVWSMEPVVRRLQPQFTAANVLACRGLDHLERKIPALQYPVEKIASELKDSISTPIQSARSTFGNSIVSTFDRVLGLTSEGYELAKNTARSTSDYTWSSRVSQVAAAGIDRALGQLEMLVNFLLPEEDHEPAREPTRVHGSKVAPSEPQPGTFSRISALASTISHCAYQQTARTIQHTIDLGQELAAWIPGLSAVARQSTAKAQQVLSDVQTAEAGWLSRGQRKEVLKKEETKANEVAEGAKSPSLVSSMAWSLQTAYLATISSMKRVPSAAWATAGELLQLSPRKAAFIASEKVGALGNTLRSVTGSMVEILSRYTLVPRLVVKKEETARENEPHAEARRSQERSRPVTSPSLENSQLRGDWQASRGHHPLSFLGLEDPVFLQPSSFQHHSLQRVPAFESDYPMSRKSAFSPYREVPGSRRVSKNVYRYSQEPVYIRAHYNNLYGTSFKKD